MAKRLRSIPPVIPHYPPDNDRGAYAPQLWYGDEAVNAADGPWYDAPPGSIYVQGGTTTGGLYHKVADTGAASDWQGITGTVNSTVGIYNVLDYGATGDGTTDDTTAIQAALTACGNAGGGTVYFPTTADAYRCTAQITVPTRTTLLGYGATIHIDGYDDTTGTPYHQFYIDTVTENITFEGLHFLGNHVAGNAFPVAGDGYQGKAILFWHPDGSGDYRHDHVRISHCVFEDIAGYPFYIEFTRDAEITGNRIVNSYAQNCNANHTRMSGNYFETSGGFEGAGVNLIITGNTWQSPLAEISVVSLGGYITPTPPVYQPGVVFSNNTIKDWAGAAKTCVLVQESAENVQITGNSLTNLTGASCIGIGNFMGTAGHEQRGIIIAQNNLSNLGANGAAIYLVSSSGLTSDVLISGNRIGKQTSSNVDVGIYCEVDGATLADNVVYTTGISVYLNGATNVRLVDNDLSSSGSVPVYLTGGATLAYANLVQILNGSLTWTPSSLADGSVDTQTITVTGCADGDIVLCDLGAYSAGVFTTAHSTANAVRVNIFNNSGGAWNPGQITTRVSVLKFSYALSA